MRTLSQAHDLTATRWAALFRLTPYSVGAVLLTCVCGMAQNPAPSECYDALGVDIAKLTAAARPPSDTTVVRVAAEIAPLLYEPHGDCGWVTELADSLVAAHGRDVLRRAVEEMMEGFVPVDDRYTDVGMWYVVLGGDLGYLKRVVSTSTRTFRQRDWALTAVSAGVAWVDEYRDSTVAQAVASVVCDMAYLLRPFLGTDFVQHVTNPPTVLHYSLSRAETLHESAIGLLGLEDLPDGRRLLELYAEWEPQPVLKERAAEWLLYVTDTEAYMRKHRSRKP